MYISSRNTTPASWARSDKSNSPTYASERAAGPEERVLAMSLFPRFGGSVDLAAHEVADPRALREPPHRHRHRLVFRDRRDLDGAQVDGLFRVLQVEAVDFQRVATLQPGVAAQADHQGAVRVRLLDDAFHLLLGPVLRPLRQPCAATGRAFHGEFLAQPLNLLLEGVAAVLRGVVEDGG